jgi:Pyridoxamine 5'-phosphate oxidase
MCAHVTEGTDRKFPAGGEVELSDRSARMAGMTTWTDFTSQATRISAVFTRRHAAAGKLCMLATLRADGFPRISPMEPRVFEDELWLVGMPDTTKFRDLARDPRFCLHTATVDTQVSDGDAKLWGTVRHVADPELHERFAVDVYEDIGLDLRGQTFDQFLAADITSASAVEITDGHLDVTVWRRGEPERVVRKH